MRKVLFLLTLLGLTVSVFAQSRKDIKIHIPTVLANPTQAQYFKDNFEMETTAAGYSVTNNASAADYTLRLSVKPNMILYDDGEEEPAGPDEKQFVLQINLTRNEDDIELVAFSFPFTDVAEMYEFNLFLLYEAMANVPLTRNYEDPENTRWRNKWVYARVSFDYPVMPFYWTDVTERLDNDDNRPTDWAKYDKVETLVINPRPAATIGVEVHYLNWMSTELNFQLRFGDPISNSTFTPSIQIQQKFPIKLLKHFMLEPYGMLAMPMNTSQTVKLPMFAAGGGVQFGVAGGNMGAFFLDANIAFALGKVRVENNDQYYETPSNIDYDNFVISIGLGYKVGFFDRSGKRK